MLPQAVARHRLEEPDTISFERRLVEARAGEGATAELGLEVDQRREV